MCLVLLTRYLLKYLNARAARIDCTGFGRYEWSHGLCTAAAGCRRRQECQSNCALDCGVLHVCGVVDVGDTELCHEETCH